MTTLIESSIFQEVDVNNKLVGFIPEVGVVVEGHLYDHTIIDFGGGTLLGALKLAYNHPTSAIIVIDPDIELMLKIANCKGQFYESFVEIDNHILQPIRGFLNKYYSDLTQKGFPQNVLLFPPMKGELNIGDLVVCNYPHPTGINADLLIQESLRYLKKSKEGKIKVKTEDRNFLLSLEELKSFVSMHVVDLGYRQNGYEDGIVEGTYASLYDIIISMQARLLLDEKIFNPMSSVFNIYETEIVIDKRQ